MTSGMENMYGFQSLLGRFTYERGQYLFEVAARYDSSYRYHRTGDGAFPSCICRLAHIRALFKENVSFVSNLKLRGSYGLVGEDAEALFSTGRFFFEHWRVRIRQWHLDEWCGGSWSGE